MTIATKKWLAHKKGWFFISQWLSHSLSSNKLHKVERRRHIFLTINKIFCSLLLSTRWRWQWDEKRYVVRDRISTYEFKFRIHCNPIRRFYAVKLSMRWTENSIHKKKVFSLLNVHKLLNFYKLLSHFLVYENKHDLSNKFCTSRTSQILCTCPEISSLIFFASIYLWGCNFSLFRWKSFAFYIEFSTLTTDNSSWLFFI